MRAHHSHHLPEEIRANLACIAFAEAGEPCPIGQNGVPAPTPHDHHLLAVLENDLACAAFAEEGEPCPIDNEEQE